MCTIEKSLRGSNRTTDARSTGMSAAVEAWLLKYARFLARKEIALLKDRGIFVAAFDKAEQTEDAFRRQLQRILETHGMRQVRDSARRTGEHDTVIPSKAQIEFVRTKEIRVKEIMENSREEVQRSLSRLIEQALRETPRPSVGELTRRIHNQFHGIASGRVTPGESGVEVGVPGRILPTRVFEAPKTVSDPDRKGALYAFSPERAALIARTELRQAENTGAMEGFKAVGIRWKKWLAFRDGRSGDRHHERMHRKVVRMEEDFVLPSGARLRYPADPEGPIGEIANCRCVLTSARRGAMETGARI